MLTPPHITSIPLRIRKRIQRGMEMGSMINPFVVITNLQRTWTAAEIIGRDGRSNQFYRVRPINLSCLMGYYADYLLCYSL